MQQQIIDFLSSIGKRFGPYILGGAIGSIIHRLRTDMSLKDFIGSIIVSIFVALSIGILAKEYFELKDTIIFVLCGVSGTFSKVILDEVEQILKNLSVYAKVKLGINDIKENNDNEENNNTNN